jgi:putative phosphoribosyl transferase
LKEDKKYFKNRKDAANQLLSVLPIDKMKKEEWIVLSTSSAGIPIATLIANELNASFDFLFTSKIVAPNNDECEVAIVSESEEVVIHEELVKAFDISLDFIFSSSKRVYEECVLKYVHRYRGGDPIADLHNKNVLLIDEGLNTSLTMMACIKTAINLGAKSVSVAVPILPDVSAPIIESIADDLYFVKKLHHFIAIDFYYEELEEVTYENIKKMTKDK